MLGQECFECKKYFKLKPGTGLPVSYCHCQYCEYEGAADTFWTEDQINYARGLVMKEAFYRIIKPSLQKISTTLKNIERSTRNSLIQFKVKTTDLEYSVPIELYSKKELETNVCCDNCGLECSVYYAFARCPNCSEINALLIYEESIEAAQKQLAVFLKPEMPHEIRSGL